MDTKTPLEKALANSHYIAGFAIFACVAGIIMSIGQWGGFSYATLLDAALMGFGAWRIAAKQSRTWAVIVTLDFGVTKYLQFSRGQLHDSSITIVAVFSYLIVRGLVGVFTYHQIKKQSVIPVSI
jgi:uncharacterized membrane protein (UPF0136 family)